MGLPRATYTAAAVVGVEGGPASLRPALVQAAADAARSRQVAARAAATLPGKATRAETLVAAVRVDAGRVPGTLILRADDADAERAATLASALAGALVAELEDRTQATRGDGEAADALRLSRLQSAAAEAHRKLAALGGDAGDPAAGRANAAARVESLRARLDAIRSILAAGNPPLGAGRDVPPTIDALQTGYLDLTRQLAKARETLGERHTTVIGLQDAIRRAASELNAAWGRLAKATEQDLAEARSRVAAAAKGGAEPARAAAIDAARAAVRVADEAVARAAAPADADDQPRWHLVARASAPALAEGLGLPLRLALAGAAGLLALLAGRRWLRRRPASDAVAAEQSAPETFARAVEPRFFDDEPTFEHAPKLAAPENVALENMALDNSALETVARKQATPVEMLEAESVSPPPHAEPVLAAPNLETPRAPSRDEVPQDEIALDEMLEEMHEMQASHADPDLVAALAQVLPRIDTVAPRAGVPVVLVATDEAGVGTMETVLALGAAAAEEGRRVLIVEGARARPALAAAVDPGAAPALVEVLGETRIVLPAEAGAGQVYLAPSFRHGARLAADLARNGTAVVADDIADEFDLVLIDGDRAGDATALAAEADAVLRVGRFASPRDAGRFLATLGAPDGAFLGTVAAAVSVFVPQMAPVRPATVAAPRPAPRAPLGVHPLRRSPPAGTRRRVAAG